MKRRKEEMEEVREIEEKEELDPKELKKKQREEKKEKRLKRKKQDKAARWAGSVMLFLIMIVGFLLWVSGQLTNGSSSDYVRPVASPNNSLQQPRSGSFASPASPSQGGPAGKVIVR